MKPVAAPVSATVPVGLEPEELVVQTGERSGATMAVAVHSTLLGPALGGARLWHYERDEDGIADALRLARGMTFKAAAAGLDLGGGKGVICSPSAEPPSGSDREAILRDSNEQFTIRNDSLVSTHGTYDFAGRSDNGKNLQPVKTYQEFWHSWKQFHPETEIYK
jgi:hypothetical protein